MNRGYLIFCVVVCCGFALASATGWSAFANKATWEPAGPGGHSGRSSHHIFFHK